MIRWEKDLNQCFPLPDWHTAIHSISKSSHCSSHREITIKILNRWYYTPYRLAKISTDYSTLCWRGCEQVGTLHHLLWSCPNLTSIWNQVFRLISSCTGIITRPDPALAILNMDIDKFPPNHRTVVTHILLSTRLLILKRWKSPLSLNISEVIQTIKANHSLELLLASANLTLSKCTQAWSIRVNNRVTSP